MWQNYRKESLILLSTLSQDLWDFKNLNGISLNVSELEGSSQTVKHLAYWVYHQLAYLVYQLALAEKVEHIKSPIQ